MRPEADAYRRKMIVALGTAGVALTVRGAGARDDKEAAIEQPSSRDVAAFVERAFDMRRLAVDSGDQGYGAVIVRAGKIVGQAPSHVVVDGDPTAHAEMEAIRDAARRLGSRNLADCVMYSSSPPCPMCEAAAYWAGIEKLVFGRSAEDGGSPRLCG